MFELNRHRKGIPAIILLVSHLAPIPFFSYSFIVFYFSIVRDEARIDLYLMYFLLHRLVVPAALR